MKRIIPLLIGLILISMISSCGERKAMSPLAKKGWAYLERVHSESSEIKCEGYKVFPKEGVQGLKKFNLKDVSNVVSFYVRGFNSYSVEIQDTLHVFYNKNEIPVCFLSSKELDADDMHSKLRVYVKLREGGLMN